MAAILVDMHVLLWTRVSPRRLSPREREVIETASPRYMSVVSLWEIAIVISLERVADDPRLFAAPAGFDLLAVMPEHCKELLALPQHRRDPFDRMPIAQTRAENLLLVTRDRMLSAYRTTGVAILYRGRE